MIKKNQMEAAAMPEDYERSKEEWEATRNLLLSDDDDDDEDIFVEDTKATPESRKPIKRIFTESLPKAFFAEHCLQV